MSRKIFRIFTTIAICILTLSLLFGGTYCYENFLYTNPLQKTMQKMGTIEKFKVEQNKDRMIIEVQFNQTGKLRPLFYQLLDEVEQQKKSNITDLVIKINNPPQREIASFLRDGKLPVYEALTNGEFTHLPEKLALLAEEKNLTYELDLDQHYVFLTAYKNGKAGYQIIKRTETPLSVFTVMGEEYI